MLALTRRQFLATSATLTAAASASGVDTLRTRPPKRSQPATKKLALLSSVYYYLSHAYHIGGRFLDGYMLDGKYHYPPQGLASTYVEQVRDGDLSRDLAKEHGFRTSSTIEDALTLGTGKLAVDGVLLICEHGDYPYNKRGQKLYPRYEYFQQVVEVFRKSGRSVPVFCDKHLSYDRKKAAEMVATAKKMGFPLMAGSSLPVTWRKPELQIEKGTKIQEGLLASRGELEIYGIHALEALQCMMERRIKDDQQGVKAVTCLQGDAVWKAGDEGKWSWDLLEHALGRSPSRNAGDIRSNCKRFRRPGAWGFHTPGPIAFLIEYLDGTRGTVLQIDGHAADETFAAKLENGKTVSTLFWLPPPPGAAFLEALARHVETFMETGRAPNPVERTQLTGGILEYALTSRVEGSMRLETPDLDIRYKTPEDGGFMRGDYEQPIR